MSRKKSNFKPNSWETVGENTLSATLYATMLQSESFKSLSNNAKVLYVYMKLQLYGQHGKNKVTDPEGKGRECFYFNKAMWINDKSHPNSYGLYKNGSQFSRDKSQLIEHGFIEEVENNWTTRDKNIYCFSHKWKEYKAPEKGNQKTAHDKPLN